MVKYVRIINNVSVVNGSGVRFIYGGLEIENVHNPLFVGEECYAEYRGEALNENCVEITEEEYLEICKDELDKRTQNQLSIDEMVKSLQNENEELKSQMLDLWELILLGGNE